MILNNQLIAIEPISAPLVPDTGANMLPIIVLLLVAITAIIIYLVVKKQKKGKDEDTTWKE